MRYGANNVTWNPNLVAAAHSRASTCYFKHTPNNRYGEVGRSFVLDCLVCVSKVIEISLTTVNILLLVRTSLLANSHLKKSVTIGPMVTMRRTFLTQMPDLAVTAALPIGLVNFLQSCFDGPVCDLILISDCLT